ncbi:MAG TPA: exodeoxyribonuclease VII small subunit [Candidatus Cybelea sp.]|jgi:exodeoxyribonuclease VII small subunit
MSGKLPQTFEQKLARIDAIVKELEGGTVELQRATQLFKEGKVLARECETLLKNAQTQIDEAMAEPSPADERAASASELDGELPF